MDRTLHPKCRPASCDCRPPTPAPSRGGLARRDFLKLLGAGGIAVGAGPLERAMAGPFTRADFERLVPADKKLSPEWIQSLTERGARTVYRGAALGNIGMPIGGICAGQLYLGGDGRLWHWDIFNRHVGTGAEHYAHPLPAASPVDQGFAVRLTAGGEPQERRLEASQWEDVSFCGEYPIGYVSYADSKCPVTVRLEAFSPFIPLNVADSSLPATVLEFTVTNSSPHRVAGEFLGWLENAVCLHSSQMTAGLRRNRVARERGFVLLECSAEEAPPAKTSDRPDVLFDDFESETYEKWQATGSAFGKGPVEAARMPAYQGDVGAHGKRLVNTHAAAPGADVGGRDAATGRLTSQPFTIERHFIVFLIGGGNHLNQTCLNLVVDGAVVRSATGAADNKLKPLSWDVRPWAGQTAHLEIVDEATGAWGNIGVDQIVFSDHPHAPRGPLAQAPDFGTLGLALLGRETGDRADAAMPADRAPRGSSGTAAAPVDAAEQPFGRKLRGSLSRKFHLAPGASRQFTFVLSWFLPNLNLSNRLPFGRSYATKFKSARDVAAYVAREFPRLQAGTRLWHDTWYDGTLPYWFLDRTFLNTSILATSTCHQLGNGRFYSWEGVGCCEGSCGHVWQYAQATARVFPELERNLRETVDFGLALQPDGAVHFRGEFNDFPAIDAQAGVVLRALREHQMSADDAFLKRIWPGVKKAMNWLIAKDADGDGLIESNQHNTLDTDWFGPVAWLSGLYQAALLAAETMAREVGDAEFAGACQQILAVARGNFVTRLFDGEYFVNRVDAKHPEAINSGTGCEIDQVMGQSWAFQVGLPRVLPEAETRAALRALWRYNFTPDVGPYRAAYKAGRWYAMPGEAGLLMCTFPRGDWDYAQAKGKGPDWAAGYFNECMNGFEYQAAGHMVWEGMVTEGLAVTRAVHDRYHASRRNPWNEVECGDHYVRSMASYGVFLAACGFEYHGPQGRMAFAPRIQPERFTAAFTAAAGWGTYRQRRQGRVQEHELEIKHGTLQLQTLGVALPPDARLKLVQVEYSGRRVAASGSQNGPRVEVRFSKKLRLTPAGKLKVRVEYA